MSERQQRIAHTASARNMWLLWLGYPQRVPQCELDGEAARKERRAYLFGVPHGFTRTDRSMAVWDGKRDAWRLVSDAGMYPGLYATKEAALAAGRAAERRADAAARAKVPAVLMAAQGWARRRDENDALHTLAERAAAGEIR